MRRVLRPGGRVLVLEFSLPAWAPFRAAYLFYLRHILPVLGGLLSGDREAYRYLNRTVETFPYGRDFCELMKRAGLVNVAHHPLTFGIATIYQGDAPP
jgi:demethylmenaquinone methyltransferase/2-methoxy-6-polyprenyl-1,4-benzoquinol methylase